MEFALVFSFIGASFLLTIMPGPDNLFVLTESVTKGGKFGVALSCGLSSGVLVHTLAAATGLSIVLQSSALAFSIIKYAGALYLFYLAYKAFREERETFSFDSKTGTFNFWELYKQGFLMNVLNPKVSLFFIAFLPQFVTPQGYHPAFQMCLLGFIFMLQALLLFSLIAIGASRMTGFLRSAKFWSATKYTKVFVLGALGIGLLLSKRT